MLTKHAIRKRGSKYYLDAGQIMTKDDFDQIVRIVNGDTDSISSIEILDKNVLSKGHNHLMWYVRGKIRPMWFNVGRKKQTYSVPWPSLIFLVRGQELTLLAFKKAGRPDLETPLFVPPLMNIDQDGSLCTGSADLPSGCHPSTMSRWENIVFKTFFTHTNYDYTLRDPKWPDMETSNNVHVKFWKSLHDAKKSAFPKQYLRPMDCTLGEFINGE